MRQKGRDHETTTPETTRKKNHLSNFLVALEPTWYQEINIRTFPAPAKRKQQQAQERGETDQGCQHAAARKHSTGRKQEEKEATDATNTRQHVDETQRGHEASEDKTMPPTRGNMCARSTEKGGVPR